MRDSQDTYTDYSDHRDHGGGNIRSVPSKATRDSNELINESWNLFEAGEINAVQLAWRVKYRTGAGKSPLEHFTRWK